MLFGHTHDWVHVTWPAGKVYGDDSPRTLSNQGGNCGSRYILIFGVNVRENRARATKGNTACGSDETPTGDE